MIAAGLRETHDLSDDELAAYLLARPGIQPGWDAAGWPTSSASQRGGERGDVGHRRVAHETTAHVCRRAAAHEGSLGEQRVPGASGCAVHQDQPGGGRPARRGGERRRPRARSPTTATCSGPASAASATASAQPPKRGSRGGEQPRRGERCLGALAHRRVAGEAPSR